MAGNTSTTGNGAVRPIDYKEAKTSHLFLVRIWLDEGAGGQESWSGKVQHVITGEAHSFSDWDGLAKLMVQMLPEGSVPQAPGAGPKLDGAGSDALSKNMAKAS